MARDRHVTLKYTAATSTTSAETTFTIGPASTRVVDVYLRDCFQVQFIVIGTYAVTASTTGLTIGTSGGIGPGDDPNVLGEFALPCALDGVSDAVVMGNNLVAQTTATYTPGSSSPQTLNHFFYVDTRLGRVPAYERISITNNDTANTVIISIVANI